MCRRNPARASGRGQGEPALHAPGLVEMDDLQRGAHLVGDVDHQGLPAPGQVERQGEHVGDDGVLLPLGQVGAQGGGVAQGELRVVQTLVAGMGGAVGGVVQVQVVEQPRPGGGPVVPAEVTGQPEGHIGHEQGVLVAGDGEVVAPALHGADLAGVQQGAHALQEGGGV